MTASRPFHVSTFGLSPDMKRAHPAFGKINRGDVSRHTLFEALEIYRRLDSDAPPSASHIAVQSAMGRFIIRRAGKQLTLAGDAEPVAQAVPLAAEEIVTRLEQPRSSLAPGAPLPPPPPPEPFWRMITAAVLVLSGVGLMIHALRPVFASERPRPGEDFTLLANASHVFTQQQQFAGMFATGQQTGDRRLTVSPNGYVEFAELGPRQALASGTDTFQIGRRGGQTFLVTARSGVIALIDRNTLVYYGDTYRRLE